MQNNSTVIWTKIIKTIPIIKIIMKNSFMANKEYLK